MKIRQKLFFGALRVAADLAGVSQSSSGPRGCSWIRFAVPPLLLGSCWTQLLCCFPVKILNSRYAHKSNWSWLQLSLMSPVSPVAADSGPQSEGCFHPRSNDKNESDQQNYHLSLKTGGWTSAPQHLFFPTECINLFLRTTNDSQLFLWELHFFPLLSASQTLIIYLYIEYAKRAEEGWERQSD